MVEEEMRPNVEIFINLSFFFFFFFGYFFKKWFGWLAQILLGTQPLPAPPFKINRS